MHRPTISVVVPVYNRAELVGATLNAILAQDSPASEIIVVDDGSTDDTPRVLAAYAPRVRTMRVENSGDLAARNAGLRAAAGDLVAFCDSDDLWRPGFLSAMGELWRDTPDLLAAYANFQAIREGRWEERTKFDQAPAGFWEGLRPATDAGSLFTVPIVERLLQFQPFFPSAMVTGRVAFLDAGGWDEAVSRITGTDFATALRVAERPMGVVRTPLVGIRRHDGNFSSDVQAMNLGDARILEHVLATRPALAQHKAAVLRSIASRRAQAADLAFDRRDFPAVRRIQAMLPHGSLTVRQRVKGLLSRLPSPVLRAALRLLGQTGATPAS